MHSAVLTTPACSFAVAPLPGAASLTLISTSSATAVTSAVAGAVLRSDHQHPAQTSARTQVNARRRPPRPPRPPRRAPPPRPRPRRPVGGFDVAALPLATAVTGGAAHAVAPAAILAVSQQQTEPVCHRFDFACDPGKRVAS